MRDAASTNHETTPGRPMAPASEWLAGDAGFSIIEVMIAALVLIIGLLGVLGMLTGAIGRTASSNQYVGATNVARELVETARGADYDQLTPTLLRTTLQARGMGAGDPWIITRRGVDYTITATSCLLDSPADRLESPAPANVCTPALAGSTGDQNGDDFRRLTFVISWSVGSQARSLTQTELIVNPAGGLGPRIKTVTPLTQTITNSATTVASVTFTTSPAAAVHWHADDGKSLGNAVLSPSVANSWSADWALGTTGLGSEVLDGAYQMIAQASDDRGVAGDAKLASVVLNRRKPYAPPTLAGGYNSRWGLLDLTVDLEWTLNSERDIAGYRVYWTGLDGILGSGIDIRACPSAASSTTLLSTTTTSCSHFLPLVTGLTKYSVVAVDRDSTGALREGDERSFWVSALGTRPAAPGGPLVASTTADGHAALSWTAPATGSPIFYRIYRDGTDRGNRIDRTGGPVTNWVDSTATSTHDYWITAIDSTYNESDPIGPVRWSPP
jgi:type II secretory pathway pseudopilin PulG